MSMYNFKITVVQLIIYKLCILFILIITLIHIYDDRYRWKGNEKEFTNDMFK